MNGFINHLGLKIVRTESGANGLEYICTCPDYWQGQATGGDIKAGDDLLVLCYQDIGIIDIHAYRGTTADRYYGPGELIGTYHIPEPATVMSLIIGYLILRRKA